MEKNRDIREEYDMLIISPRKFGKIVEKLISHKERFGIRCKFRTPAEIYREIKIGRDEAEKIKFFCKERIRSLLYKICFIVRWNRFYSI